MIFGIGNAIMDITARVNDSFLAENGVEKGLMALVDVERTQAVMTALTESGIEMGMSAGGSVANSIAGIAAAGRHDTHLFFRVGDDELGSLFCEQTAAGGTGFSPELCVVKGGATGRSIILVTPDGERTMLTHLGVASSLGPEHVDMDLVRTTRLGFFEGYLFDAAGGRDTYESVRERNMAITLSDPRCVTRNLDAFTNALRSVRIVIGNGKEMSALGEGSPEDGIDRCRSVGALAVCTRSSAPALVTAEDLSIVEVPVPRVENVLDTTGAGDQFAAGVLDGLLSGLTVAESAGRGGEWASAVIQHAGARPPLPAEDIKISEWG